VHGDLDGAAHALVDQLAQRPRRRGALHSVRLPATLAHGAFLRFERPLWQAAGLMMDISPVECAVSLFHINRDTTAGTGDECYLSVV
jgi:hypothetical protein